MSAEKENSNLPAPAADEPGKQMDLLTAEEESALFLPADELRKRYTGAQAEKMEWRRNACVRMLAYGIPAEYIARDLHMNLRTVTALAGQYAKEVIQKGKSRTDYMEDEAMADLGAASTKRANASFKDLHIGAGIKLTHVANRRVMEDGIAPAENITAESERRAKFLERLKQLAPSAEPLATETPKGA